MMITRSLILSKAIIYFCTFACAFTISDIDLLFHAGSVKDENIRSLVFGDYMSEERLYDEVVSQTDLQKRIEYFLEEFNTVSKSPMRLVLFKFAIEHISRVARVLKQDNGHALLVGIGGSGRQSAAKLATFMSDYDLFQIELTRVYGFTEWRDDIKRVRLVFCY